MNNCHSRSPSSSESSEETMPKINNISQNFVARTTSKNLQIPLQPQKNKLKRTSDAINENNVEQMSSSVLMSPASTTCHKNTIKKRRLPSTRNSGGFVNNIQCSTEIRAKPIAQLTNISLQNTPSTKVQNTQYQQQPSYKSSFPSNFFHLRPPLQSPHFNVQGLEDNRMNPKMTNPLAPITLVPYPIPIILPMVIPIPIPMNAIDFLKAYHLHDCKMKETLKEEVETTTTTSVVATAITTAAVAKQPILSTTTTKVDTNDYNEPIDYTKSKSNNTSSIQDQMKTDQTTINNTTVNNITSSINNVERKLPKFKITRLHSKQHFTKEFIESCRPLRKRKRITDDDDNDNDKVNDADADNKDKGISS